MPLLPSTHLTAGGGVQVRADRPPLQAPDGATQDAVAFLGDRVAFRRARSAYCNAGAAVVGLERRAVSML